jgi:hypothetical protein
MSIANPFRALLIVAAFSLSARQLLAEDTRVAFDVPDRIECKDVTPAKCAVLHPTVKVIEAKFRISASIESGSEASLVDFTYMISSPGLRMKVLDYLPNTTLESRYADDRIKVEDFTSEADSMHAEAKVAYTIFSLNAVKNRLTQSTELNNYEKIAPKALVLASGTMNRGHGVFYKLRPSNMMSLEGSKEFSFLAIVPREWRGDWCTFVCSGRGEKKNLLGKTIETVGVSKVDVGLYLCGDEEAGNLASRLCAIQQADNGALARRSAHEAAKISATLNSPTSNVNQTVAAKFDDLFHQVTRTNHFQTPTEKKLDEARVQMEQVEELLAKYSGAELNPDPLSRAPGSAIR